MSSETDPQQPVQPLPPQPPASPQPPQPSQPATVSPSPPESNSAPPNTFQPQPQPQPSAPNPQSQDAPFSSLLDRRDSFDLTTLKEDNSSNTLKEIFPDFQQNTNPEDTKEKVVTQTNINKAKVAGNRGSHKLLKFIILQLIPLILFIAGVVVGTGYFLAAPSGDNEIPESDVIIVLTETGALPLQKAGELFSQQKAPKVILVGEDAGEQRGALESFGVPVEHIIIESQAETTAEDAVYTEKICDAENFSSIILVTASYHQRRTLWSFQGAFRYQEATFTSVPVEVPAWDWLTWWTTVEGVEITWEELQETWNYWREGYF